MPLRSSCPRPARRSVVRVVAPLLLIGWLFAGPAPAESGARDSLGDPRPLPSVTAERLRESLAGRSDSCRVEWSEPFFYLWDWAQARCEATRCELTGAQTISAVAVVLYNYGTAPAEKPLRVYLQEDAAGMPGATLWSLETTTTLLAAGETKSVVFIVDPPVQVSGPGPIWLGHQEYASGPPSSLFDGQADAIQASSTAPCGSWTPQDLGDYLQYLPVEVPSAVSPPAIESASAIVSWRSLSQPARGAIRVELELARAQAVSLDLFSLSGRRVESLLSGERLAAGLTTRAFDATRIPSGLYLLRLEAGNETLTRKLLLLH